MATVKLKLKDSGGAGLRSCGVLFSRDTRGKAIPQDVEESHLPYLLQKYGHKLVRCGDDEVEVDTGVIPPPDVKDPLEMTRIERAAKASGKFPDDDEVVVTPKSRKKPGPKTKTASKTKTKTVDTDPSDGAATVTTPAA